MYYNTNNTVENNYIKVSGKVVDEPKFTHTIQNEKFFQFKLAVKRLSGTVDLLPICISEYLIDERFYYGDKIAIEGQIRSYDTYENDKHHVVTVVFAKNVLPYSGNEDTNTVKLDCYLGKEPAYRRTPLGREICDLLVAVNRPYGRCDYIHCITWSRSAKFASTLKAGTHLELEGRLQSRNYIKPLENDNIEIRTAYELSINRITVLEQ